MSLEVLMLVQGAIENLSQLGVNVEAGGGDEPIYSLAIAMDYLSDAEGLLEAEQDINTRPRN